jgi:hypothetical protein
MVGNQVLLILVDSGSSNCFINAAVVDMLKCNTQPIPTVPIKIANGEVMQCTQVVSNLSWWCQGETFTTNMIILELGAYVAILGI